MDLDTAADSRPVPRRRPRWRLIPGARYLTKTITASNDLVAGITVPKAGTYTYDHAGRILSWERPEGLAE